MFASAHDFPKFVKVGAAMEHELRKVGTSGVDLTFATLSPGIRDTNVKSKTPLETYIC